MLRTDRPPDDAAGDGFAPAPVPSSMNLGIIGAGSLGSALGELLGRAGHTAVDAAVAEA